MCNHYHHYGSEIFQHQCLSNTMICRDSLTFRPFKISSNDKPQHVTLELGNHHFMKDTASFSTSKPDTINTVERIYNYLHDINTMMYIFTQMKMYNHQFRSELIMFASTYNSSTNSYNGV